LFLVINTSAVDCLERLVSEMTCYVSSGTLNPTHSLTHLGLGCVFVVFLRLCFCGLRAVVLAFASNLLQSKPRLLAGLFCRCSLSSEEIQRRYNEGTQAEADETTRIMSVPVSEMSSLQTDQQSVWTELAPSAKGCISLYVLHGPPEPPYQPAVLVT